MVAAGRQPCFAAPIAQAFVPADAPMVLGLDDHLERRRGAKIKAKGIYRDACRSSTSFFVKACGLRWLSMLLASVPWAQRVWALLLLTVMAPSERSHQERNHMHKVLTDWARQMTTHVRAWLPERLLVVVADSTYAAIDLLAPCQGLPMPVTMVTWLRLGAALYDPALPPTLGQRGRPRKKVARQPSRAARLADPATMWQEASLPW